MTAVIIPDSTSVQEVYTMIDISNLSKAATMAR